MAKKGAQNDYAFTLSKTTRRVLKDKKTQYTGDPNNRYLKYSTHQKLTPYCSLFKCPLFKSPCKYWSGIWTTVQISKVTTIWIPFDVKVSLSVYFYILWMSIGVPLFKYTSPMVAYLLSL